MGLLPERFRRTDWFVLGAARAGALAPVSAAPALGAGSIAPALGWRWRRLLQVRGGLRRLWHRRHRVVPPVLCQLRSMHRRLRSERSSADLSSPDSSAPARSADDSCPDSSVTFSDLCW